MDHLRRWRRNHCPPGRLQELSLRRVARPEAVEQENHPRRRTLRPRRRRSRPPSPPAPPPCSTSAASTSSTTASTSSSPPAAASTDSPKPTPISPSTGPGDRRTPTKRAPATIRATRTKAPAQKCFQPSPKCICPSSQQRHTDMEITQRELITILHGTLFGGFFVMATFALPS